MSQKVFRDPIYGDIEFDLPADRVLLDLIDTASFQRLRRINQLGVSYLAFHGAEHSRFTHSLGTLHLMTLAFEHLLREAHGKDAKELLRYRQSARIVALLHDIGHGPFSHNFEQIVPAPHARRHEEWSSAIITGDTDIARILKKHRVAPRAIADIINHRFAACPAVQELLSGHLDIDRMDYLLRDSHATGVKYGIFDWERLLRSLTVYRRGSKLHLALTDKGLHALEELILARYFMYDQVYLHKTVLGAEFLLKMILRRAQDLVKQELLLIRHPVLAKLFTKKQLILSEYVQLDDTLLTATIVGWSRHPDPILADLADRFISRRLLVSVATPHATRMAKKMGSIASKYGFDPKYYVGILDTSLAPYPPESFGKKVADTVIMTDGKPTSARTASSVIRQFHGKRFATQRVCCPREVREKTR